MPQIPFGTAVYKRADLPPLRLLNLFAEKTPAVEGNVALLPRPGLSAFFTAGDGPIYGMLRQPGALADTTMIVSGQSLHNGSIYIGPLPNLGLVNMSGAIGAFLIATGTALYWTDGGSVAAVAFPDSAGVQAVNFIGGYAIAARADSRRLYYTLDPLTWDGLDYLSAEQSTGDIVGLAVVNDQVWVFCQQVTEIFVLTGNADAPLQPLQGQVMTRGCMSRDTIAQMDNSIFWVGDDGVVYRGGAAPIRVSDHSIEQAIAASTPSQLNAWTFPWVGHRFYVLNTGQGTFAFDAATQQWTEFGTQGFSGLRGWLGFQLDANTVFVGDSINGTIWTLDGGSFKDGDTLNQTVFPALVQKRGYLDNVTVECSVGTTATPEDPAGIMEMRSSRDGGSTWSPWRQDSLGLNGRSRTLISYRRCGLVDLSDMILEFRVTSNVPRRTSWVKINESTAGRGR